MKFEITRGGRSRPVAKLSKNGCTLYLQAGAGIEGGKHVAIGGMYGNRVCVNGMLDVTVPAEDCMSDYQDVFEGDTVSITF